MNQNFKKLKTKIIEELNKRTPNLKCPVCENRKMILIDGFLNRPLQNEILGNLMIEGPSVPTVAIACETCGHFMEFTAGVLGVLENYVS